MSIRPILLIVSAVCPLVVVAVSCGGSESDLFGNVSSSSSAAQGSGTAGGSTGSGSGQGGASSSGASSSVSAGGAGAAGGAGGGGGQNTGGSLSSAGGAGGGSQSSASMSSSGSGGPTDPQVYCNDQPCAPGEVCCWSQFMGQDSCSAPGGCSGMGYAEISCNDIEDCAPGERCCGTFSQFLQTYTSVQCQASCNMGQYTICTGHPELCPMGQSCNQSGYLGMGYMVCQ